MNYHWNWRIFWEESPDGVRTYGATLVDGLQWTLAAAAGGWIMGPGAGLFDRHLAHLAAVGGVRALAARGGQCVH